jgi:hypothetical protein
MGAEEYLAVKTAGIIPIIESLIIVKLYTLINIEQLNAALFFISYLHNNFKLISMKKMFTLILSLSTATAIFAQGGDRNNHQYDNNRPYGTEAGRQNNDGRAWDDRTTVYNHNDEHRGGYDGDRRFDNDRQRQAERDRVNREYDQRINDYRHDRSINDRERGRRIQAEERQRSARLKTIGGALLLGGVIGVLLAHH